MEPVLCNPNLCKQIMLKPSGKVINAVFAPYVLLFMEELSVIDGVCSREPSEFGCAAFGLYAI